MICFFFLAFLNCTFYVCSSGFVPINDFGVRVASSSSSAFSYNDQYYTYDKIKICSSFLTSSLSSSSSSQLCMTSEDNNKSNNVSNNVNGVVATIGNSKPKSKNKKQSKKKKSKNTKQGSNKKSHKNNINSKTKRNNQIITNKVKNSTNTNNNKKSKNGKSLPINNNNNNVKKKKKKQKQKPYTSKKSKSLSLSSEDNLIEKGNLFGRELSPLTELKLGSEINGYVAAFTDFGVFIKTDYDFKNKNANGYGLLHKSQIRDEPIEDLTKLFRIGARVKGLRVININYAKGEVGLSLRKQRLKRKDWMDVPLNEDIEGVVSKIVSYGAFVDVGADVNALVHISRISQRKIRNIQQVIREGEKVTIHILSKDESNKTMAASMLDRDADEYLDRRSVQMKKMRESSNAEFDGLKSELEYFEDAVRELEEALGQ